LEDHCEAAVDVVEDARLVLDHRSMVEEHRHVEAVVVVVDIAVQLQWLGDSLAHSGTLEYLLAESAVQMVHTVELAPLGDDRTSSHSCD
jgi:hypothetical protein